MRSFLFILLAPLTVAAAGPVQAPADPLDLAVRQARAEQTTAERRAAALEKTAAAARDTASRLRAQQAAAAEAIEAAEARITAADAELRLLSAQADARRRRLEEQQRPAAALVAGLAVMGERPPLLAIADRASADEIVTLRILLDSTLPTIRRRTAALSAQLAESQRLERRATAARSESVQSRRDLLATRERFSRLEQQALTSAAELGGRALSSGDLALAAGENVEQLSLERGRASLARAAAQDLAAGDAAPAGPIGSPLSQHFQYRMPAIARVVDGLGSVNASGVRSRGIELATVRGTSVLAPASGIVRFAGPFKDHDGVVIIDHGGGWMSLLVDVSSPLRPGQKVRIGDPLGRALGPIRVELSQNGRHVSPALIAGSSQSLSKDRKGG